MLLEHNRYHDLGMDALVAVRSWNPSVSMVWAWMLFYESKMTTDEHLTANIARMAVTRIMPVVEISRYVHVRFIHYPTRRDQLVGCNVARSLLSRFCLVLDAQAIKALLLELLLSLFLLCLSCILLFVLHSLKRCTPEPAILQNL